MARVSLSLLTSVSPQHVVAVIGILLCLIATQATLSSNVFLCFIQFIAIVSGRDVSDQVHFLFWQFCIVRQSITLSLHWGL